MSGVRVKLTTGREALVFKGDPAYPLVTWLRREGYHEIVIAVNTLLTGWPSVDLHEDGLSKFDQLLMQDQRDAAIMSGTHGHTCHFRPRIYSNSEYVGACVSCHRPSVMSTPVSVREPISDRVIV